MNRIKRICASLLAAMMVFTYMPAMAFAADTGSPEWFDNYTFNTAACFIFKSSVGVAIFCAFVALM